MSTPDRAFTPTNRADLALWLSREHADAHDARRDAEYVRGVEDSYDRLNDRYQRLTATCAALADERDALVWTAKDAARELGRLDRRLLLARRWRWCLAGALFGAVMWGACGFQMVGVAALGGATVGACLGCASEEA